MRGSVEFGLVLLFLAVMHSKGKSLLLYASGYAAPSCSTCSSHLHNYDVRVAVPKSIDILKKVTICSQSTLLFDPIVGGKSKWQ